MHLVSSVHDRLVIDSLHQDLHHQRETGFFCWSNVRADFYLGAIDLLPSLPGAAVQRGEVARGVSG